MTRPADGGVLMAVFGPSHAQQQLPVMAPTAGDGTPDVGTVVWAIRDDRGQLVAIGVPCPVPEPPPVVEGPQVGELRAFALAPSSPLWLPCDGRGITSAMGFPLLRDGLIGATYPYGTDVPGNPRIPDYRDRALVGAGPTHTAGHAFGTETVTLTSAQSGRPAATLPGPTTGSGSFTGGAIQIYTPPWTSGAGGTLPAANAAQPHPNTQPSLATPIYIRAA